MSDPADQYEMIRLQMRIEQLEAALRDAVRGLEWHGAVEEATVARTVLEQDK